MVPLTRSTVPVALLTLALISGWPGSSAAQETAADDLAVRASGVHAEHCADIHASDMTVAVQGYAAVAEIWGELDSALKEADAPQPYLLYWRGLLSQCLNRDAEAASDLEGFLKATEFLGAVDETRQGQLKSMARDAQKRLKRLGSDDTTAARPQPKPVDGKRGSGAALLVAGSLAAAGGISLNAGLVHSYYQPATTDQETYERARGGAVTGAVIGIAGAAVALTGFIVLVAPHKGDATVALLPGPVPNLVVRF